MVLRNYGQPWARPSRLGMERLMGHMDENAKKLSRCEMGHKGLENWVRGGETMRGLDDG